MLTLPVIVYFYISSLSDSIKKHKTFNDVIPHFFIPLQSLAFNIYPFFFSTHLDKNLMRINLDYTNYFSLKVIFVVLNIYYLTLVVLDYKKHRDQIKNILSYEVGVSLNWVLFFLFGYISFIVCFFILNPDSSPYVVYLPLLLVLIYIFFQRNSQITVNLNEEKITDITLVKLTTSIQSKSGLVMTDEKIRNLKKKLIDYVEIEKPYLKKDLTIHDVAKGINTNSNYISYILNNSLNCNFVTFVNSYRIEEAKKILVSKKYSNFTIEAIGEIVGFNSKSAFNTSFKKITGLTPSNYIKKTLHNEAVF